MRNISLLLICFIGSTVHGFPRDINSNFQPGKPKEENSNEEFKNRMETSREEISLTSGDVETNNEGKLRVELEDEKKEPLEGKTWAFLVAGSSGWINYRHQADICHAYQLLFRRGIPRENIIVMMKDDIANNTQNPRKGVLINEPGGDNVYEGVRVDYKGEDVTPENFLKVLEGDKKGMEGIGTGRVIESTEKDRIFLNYDDHGSFGFVSFPKSKLTVKDLSDAVNRMIDKKRFDKLLMYVEACESGSMADNVYPSDSSVVVLTASGRYESSWGAYCSTPDMPCLGDVFSVTWMRDLEKEFFLKNNTLFSQFDSVRTDTVKSHVNLYGDYSFGNLKTETFFGADIHKSPINARGLNKKTLEDAIDSRDAALHYVRRMAEKEIEENDSGKMMYRKLLAEIEEGRELIDATFSELINTVSIDEKETKEIIQNRYPIDLRKFSCYENLLNIVSSRCFDIYQNAYSLRHSYKLYNMCLMAEETGRQIETLVERATETVCNEKTQSLTGVE